MARLILLAVVVLLAGCAARPAAPRAVPLKVPSEPHIRVGTYNVNYGAPDPRSVLAAIEQADADILCVQESTPQWETLLRQRFAARYPHMLFRHAPAAGGHAVLSKFPVNEVAYVEPTVGWFPNWLLKAQTPLGDVQLLSVHLRPALSDRGSVSAGAYFTTKPLRKAELADLLERLDPDVPALIVGDFNESENGQALAAARNKGFGSALEQHDRRTETWRWRTSLITLRDRLDHILYSRELTCLDARVIPAGASDHLPVVAVFTATPIDPPSPLRPVAMAGSR